MRPETELYNIRKAIRKSLYLSSFYPLRNVRKELNSSLNRLIKNGDDCENYYGDCRSENNLMYISDRFNCSGRIRWLIHIIDNNYTMEV